MITGVSYATPSSRRIRGGISMKTEIVYRGDDGRAHTIQVELTDAEVSALKNGRIQEMSFSNPLMITRRYSWRERLKRFFSR